MGGEWELMPVGAVADSISQTHARTKDELVFLNTSDVLLGKVLHQNYSEVSRWPGQAKKSIRRDDILLSEIRPANGRWAFIDFDARDFVVSTKLMVIRARRERVVPRFLYHFLTSTQTIRWLQHLAESRSGTFPQITFDQVADLEIRLPPLDAQQAIADFLDCLDDKIELNRRMSETLEGMARALFKSWFVDFDPVRAKVDGRWKPGQSLPGLPAHLYDLFPDSFEDSELGEIPKGWEMAPIGDIAYLSRDGLNPGLYPGEIFDHFSIPAFDEGRTPKPDFGADIKSNKHLASDGCVLVSKLNPRIPRVWFPGNCMGRRAICSTEFLVVLPGDGCAREFLFCLLSSDRFNAGFSSLVTGTSGSHQRVRPQAFLQLEVVTSPKHLVKLFSDTVSPVLSRIAEARAETRALAELRDTLLPKLIAGELRPGGMTSSRMEIA